jgi:hypothetical protein
MLGKEETDVKRLGSQETSAKDWDDFKDIYGL